MDFVNAGGQTSGVLAFDGPFYEHLLERRATDGFRQVIVHACLLAFLFVALYSTGCHRYDGNGSYAIISSVRFMVSDEMSCSVTVKNGHLYVH